MAAARFRAALPRAREVGDASYLAELLTQLARAEGLQGHFDIAQSVLDEAFDLATDELPRARVRYLLERGRVFNSSGKPDEARPLFLQAWELARAAEEEYLAVDAAHMMGIVAPLEDQLAWNLRALEIAQAPTQEGSGAWLGSLYNNIGWGYHELGQFETALDYFERALAVRRSSGQRRQTRIAAWAVGRALRSLERYDEALALQEDNLRAATADGEAGAFILEELGELHFARNDVGAARDYFAQAYALLSGDKWLLQHEMERLERLRRLGGVVNNVKP